MGIPIEILVEIAMGTPMVIPVGIPTLPGDIGDGTVKYRISRCVI